MPESIFNVIVKCKNENCEFFNSEVEVILPELNDRQGWIGVYCGICSSIIMLPADAPQLPVSMTRHSA